MTISRKCAIIFQKEGKALMRIVFCDDDPLILQQLQAYVKEFFAGLGGSEPEYAVFRSGDALIGQESKFDIAFLDVEMPGASGIHTGVKLKEKNPRIKIFIITAYPDYLDEAMRFQVFRYLSKPIDKTRLFRNLKDAVYSYNIETCEIPIETGTDIYVRRSDEIICVETKNRKTVVHTTDGDLISGKNMEHWREALSLPCFYMTHRSYIINMRFVYSIGKDNVILRDGECQMVAFLSKRKFTHFKNTYLVYMESTK